MIAFFAFVQFFPATVLHAARPEAEKTGDVIYKFSDHLAESETVMRYEIEEGNRKETSGEWKGDSFYFAGPIAKKIEVKPMPFIIDAISRKAIHVKFPGKSSIQCRFFNVVPGSEMNIYYGPEPTTAEKTSRSSDYLNFRIWAGRHELKHLRIKVEEGWTYEKIDLGIIPFLNREVPITFEIASETEGLGFNFVATIRN